MKKIANVLFLCIACVMPALASDDPAFIRGIRPLGMGGAFVAIADDQNAIFYNPAGLTQRQGAQFTLFELPMNISEDVLNFYNFYNDNEDRLKDFDNLPKADQVDLLNQINDRITTYKAKLRLGFPNSSYLSRSHFITWGFGIYNQEDIGFQFNRSLIIPNISVWGNADVIAALPLAHRFNSLPYLPGKISVGATVKYIERGKISELNKSILEFDNLDPDLQLGGGLGADLGLLYQPWTRWNFGLQVTDVGGTNIKYGELSFKDDDKGKTDKPSYTSMIDPETNIGVAYIPSKIYYWPGKYIGTQDRLIFACDLRDVLNSDDPLFESTFWTKLHLGAEFRVGPLSLRGGYSSGYPALGFGVRIPYLGLRVDYAYWGDELGRYAGQQPEFNHQITLGLSWGDSNGRAYGNDTAKNQATVASKKLSKKDKGQIKKSADEALTKNDDEKAAVNAADNKTAENATQAAPAAATEPAQAVPSETVTPAVSAPAAEAPAAVTPAAEEKTPDTKTIEKK